ncbi:MAG: hypothetical protein KC420_04750 [Myxococcales bacterium]|nr:hypothetical protein [Myxococcales bacterium]MCB9567823.1 hypothetical protein [Myxococcales bacterium]MCB9700269.1 hypothetical protein [Myxococcales bacterium]
MSRVIASKLRFAGALAGLVLLMGGCGDDGTGSESGSASASTGDATSGGSGSSGSASGSATDNSGSASDSAGSSGGVDTDTAGADGCTSKTYWTMGDLESPLMHPGGACLTCHDKQVGEDIVGRLAIAGTVYPTLHEPDDCNGITNADGPVTVEITTADNQVINLSVNSAGNFFYDLEENPPIMFPVKAKVKRGGMELAMAAEQATGDCNSCHSEAGANNAPGRIIAP